MTSPWTESAAIETLAEAIGSRLDGDPLALLLDIDGTLAPIAPRPEDAAVPRETRAVLERLAALPGVAMSFITGRAAADAARMIDLPGAWIVGNHGLEVRSPAGNVTASAAAREYQSAVQRAITMLRPLGGEIPGARVEDKHWSLAVHYRLVAPDRVAEVRERALEISASVGLRPLEGKMMLELRPPVAVDKGTAAVAIAASMTATGPGASLLHAGDDRTDEDAFRALRAQVPRAITFRVLSDGDRADVATEAEFVLGSPEQLRRVLEWLAARRTRGRTR